MALNAAASYAYEDPLSLLANSYASDSDGSFNDLDVMSDEYWPESAKRKEKYPNVALNMGSIGPTSCGRSLVQNSWAKSLLDMVASDGEGSARSNQFNGGEDDTDDDIVATQMKLNTNIIAEVESLRKERNELLTCTEKSSKEIQYLKAKLFQTAEQLDYLKKKCAKQNKDAVEMNNDDIASELNGNDDEAESDGRDGRDGRDGASLDGGEIGITSENGENIPPNGTQLRQSI